MLTRRNGQAANIDDVPPISIDAFRALIMDRVNDEGDRVTSLFAYEDDGAVHLLVVLANDAAGQLGIARTRLTSDAYPSLTEDVPQVHLFEREIAEQYGIRPSGHPWLKPVRYHRSWRGGHEVFAPGDPAVTNFFRVDGDEVHEVAVGPVHAGVIEPGHFRFQCHGEDVFHLEIALGYQHRGVERALVGGPAKRSVHYLETVAGDTTIGHSIAYAQAIEGLSGVKAPARAQAIRGIALELERLANHTGDLGALSGDVAYLPTMSYCGRLRGDFLNATAEICGSRFGRGLVRPGGVLFDIDATRATTLAKRVAVAMSDTASAVQLLFKTPTVIERFESTGTVTPDQCDEIGLVGIAARACGKSIDVRRDFPFGIYRFVHLPVVTAHHGDVNSRAMVRWMEIRESAAFVAKQLSSLPQSQTRAELAPMRPRSIVVSLTEGWRGEICHVAMTGADGRFSRYKITDPSFHNWFGLALALRGGHISDFPLCNKSFNLSYCGHDL